MSRDLNLLTPTMKEFAIQLQKECTAAGIPIVITCTARTLLEQCALYVQGREPLEVVNTVRKAAGMYALTDSENKRRVTWLLKSAHLIDRDNETTRDDFAKALDFAIVKKGKAVWDLKVNINNNEIPDYQEVGAIAKKIRPDIIWGGDWKNKDWCHLEEPV